MKALKRETTIANRFPSPLRLPSIAANGGSGGASILNALFFLSPICSSLADAMTDYEYGVFRTWSFKTHGILDYGVAATSAALPKLLDLEDGAAAAYFYAQGGGETVIAGISNYEDNSGAGRQLKADDRRNPDQLAA